MPWIKRWDVILSAAVIAALAFYLIFVFEYASGYGDRRLSIFNSLKNLWGYPDWQHCALVPFILTGLLFYQRDQLFTSPAKGSWWGLPLLMAGFFFYFVGYKTNVYYFGFGGIQILVAAGIVWILGWLYFRKLFFHWCFLAFVWPLYFLTDSLAFKLRLVMIKLSSAFLNLVGVTNVPSGTSIQSSADFDAGIEQGARFALDIADPCSGIRSLFALMMVTALWAYLTLKKPWQRIALFAAAVPLAVFGNFVRVNLLVFGSILWGTEVAIGEEGGTSSFHFLAGIAVFVVALGGMVLLGKFLKSGWKIFRRPQIVRTVRGNPVTETPSP